MKKIVFVLLLSIAYYAHARTIFSESNLQKWVVESNLKAYSGDKAGCDVFAKDAVMRNVSNDETIEGRDNICNTLKITAAALTLGQGSLSSSFDGFQIKRSGFPWLEAEVTYTENATVTFPNLPPIQASSGQTIVVARTFSGLEIKSLTETVSED